MYSPGLDSGVLTGRYSFARSRGVKDFEEMLLAEASREYPHGHFQVIARMHAAQQAKMMQEKISKYITYRLAWEHYWEARVAMHSTL